MITGDLSVGKPTIGRAVWVIDGAGPEQRVWGRIVNVATDEFPGEPGSIVIEIRPGHVQTASFSTRGVEWDYATPE